VVSGGGGGEEEHVEPSFGITCTIPPVIVECDPHQYHNV
jgi:hypothetical protein